MFLCEHDVMIHTHEHFLKKIRNYFIPHQENDFKPHFFGTASILFLAGIIIVVFLVSVLQYAAISGGNFAAVISSTLVDLANSDRTASGKRTLALSGTLTTAAQMKANDMAAKSYFAHTSPEGVSPWYWFAKEGYLFLYAGENLAVNFSDSMSVEQAWMNSPGHKANILNDRFTEIGIATAQGIYNGRNTTFVVQFFGKPAAAKVAQVGKVTVKKETTRITVAPTTPVPALADEVAGASLETVVLDDMFIAVKNNELAAADETSLPIPSAFVPAQVSFATRLFASPHTMLAYAYAALAALIVIAVALDICIEIRRQHPMHIVYASILLALIFVLIYLSRAYFFPELLIL